MKRPRVLVALICLLPLIASAQSQNLDILNITAVQGNGIRFWQSDLYKIHMGVGTEYQYGPVSDYSIKFNMDSNPNRGWVFGMSGQVPVAAINNGGHMQIAGNFTAMGNIILPSVSGNRQIYTWSPSDDNWRIGMSGVPGFSRSIATAHVQYLTYTGSVTQGFAVGVNGAESSFEVTGDHRAFFRGNVALGTTTLNNEKLAIVGTSQWHVRLQDSNGGTNWRLGSSGAAWAAGGGKFIVSNSDNSAEGSLAIDNQKRVGIGTVNPSARLDVVGSGNSTIDLKVNGRILTGDNYGNGGVWLNSAGTMFVGQLGSSDIGLFNGDWRLVVNNSGNIGVGTRSPDQKLTVKGKIHSEEVIIDLSVPTPDYVFEQNYPLTPLDTVQAYIAQHKHLPEVPSAAEIEKDGVRVGEMEMILLKKIEEITLHLIEMKKLNDAQTEQMMKMQEELNQLRKK